MHVYRSRYNIARNPNYEAFTCTPSIIIRLRGSSLPHPTISAMHSYYHHLPILRCHVFFILCLLSEAAAQSSTLAPALITFGDSTVDVGMNNRLLTVVKSDFLPYGRDFITGKPTGRFSNGLLPVDYIAKRLGFPILPYPYLNPDAKGYNLIYGVNFASSGSGFNENTAKQFNVYSLSSQLQMFEQYQTQLADVVGSSHASYILSEAVYVISTGSNDYVNNYLLNLGLRRRVTKEQYRDFLVQQASNFIQQLISMGGRRIGLISLPPLGCLPSQITLYGRGERDKCIEWLNDIATDINQHLLLEIERLRTVYNATKIAYLDSYSILFDIAQNPTKYGMEVADRGCCGTGELEVSLLCNRASIGTCEDASKYVFWDSFHPTQTGYEIVANYLFDTGEPQLL